MFDVIPLDENAGVVPFVGGLLRWFDGGGKDVVTGGGFMFRVRSIAALWVDHLVFVADSFAAFFEDEILDPVVRAFGNFPVPGGVEFGEFFGGDDVAGFAAGLELEFAIFNHPSFYGHRLLFESPPA